MANNTPGFRTALSGFHKGDVTGYLDKITSQHRSEVQQYEQQIASLQEENRALQQQINLLMMSAPLMQESVPAPVPETTAAPVQNTEPVPASDEKQDLMHLELLAYRRAEAVEYNARQRAKKLYQQLGTVCDDALDQFQTTEAAVKQALQEALSQINALEQSYQKISSSLLATKEQLTTMSDTRGSAED